jgi:hypothetical protein
MDRHNAMVIVLVADGARPDLLHQHIDRGELPALARMRAEGGMRTLTSVFPSVTGPAYTPFLMGRFPGGVGLPGLRWYDRARDRCTFPDYSRSYVGAELRHLAGDLDKSAPTLFELATRRLGGRTMLTRGLRNGEQLDSGMRHLARITRVHFSGDLHASLEMDREFGRLFVERIRRERPEYAFMAFLGVDKVSHAGGAESPLVLEALKILDDSVAALRCDAEREGYWRRMSLWVVSDHGHAPVENHLDLERWMVRRGTRVRAHPWVYGPGDAAVMVSGNAMAHLYLDLAHRSRPWWRSLVPRWGQLMRALEAHPAVDVMLLPLSEVACEVRAFGRGRALVEHQRGRFRYVCLTGDPLGIGECGWLDPDEAHAITAATEYPDALVQVASLASAPRAGDVILSAMPGWDFRARYEPIPHVSSHGSLRRSHMLVPFLASTPTSRTPRRTTDLMPSAVAALGLREIPGLDGRSFL